MLLNELQQLEYYTFIKKKKKKLKRLLGGSGLFSCMSKMYHEHQSL